VNEPWIDDVLQSIPHQGRRVLVPARLVRHFQGIEQQGGMILPFAHKRLRKAILTLARAKLGSIYRSAATPDSAPTGYSCSTLTYWVYAFVGLHLPRYAIDQSYVGHLVVKPVSAGLAFYKNRFPIKDRGRAIGHVGITTRKCTIIHGSSSQERITEVPLPEGATLFTDPLPRNPQALLFIPQKIQGVRTALDLLRWLERPPLH
jgi:hypothetical protein